MRKFYSAPEFWLGIAVVLTLLAIFWDPLFSDLTMWGPDASSFAYVQRQSELPAYYFGFWDNLIGLGWRGMTQPMQPYHAIDLLASAQAIRPLVYIASVLGSILAARFWFHGYGIRGWPACLSALALALTTHTFSLISAGHDGKTLSWPFLILLLASIHRGMTRQSPFYFVLAGYAAGVAASLQSDVALLFMLPAGAYGLFLFIRCWPSAPVVAEVVNSGHPRFRYAGRIVLGVALAGVMLVCITLSSLRFLVNVALPDRERMATVGGTAQDTEESQWEFATNWSLPPEEVLEFVTAGLFGWQTGDDTMPWSKVDRLRVPYWGRTGRTLGWEKTHQGLMSLRQNTHYLGAIQWVFALFAVAYAFREIRASRFKVGESRGGSPNAFSKVHALGFDGIDIFFWAAVLLASILFALGRNFPLYRFFHMLPVYSVMRAPTKFLHVAEISLCVLFAFGLDRFFRTMGDRSEMVHSPPVETAKSKGKPSKMKSLTPVSIALCTVFAIGCGVISLAMFLTALLIPAFKPSLLEVWRAQGFAQASSAILQGMVWATARGGLLFLAATGCFLVVRYVDRAMIVRRLMPFALLAVLAWDLVYVNKHFVNVWDAFVSTTPREILAGMKGDRAEYRVGMPIAGGIYEAWKHYSIFSRQWVTVLDAENVAALPPDDQAFYGQLRRNPLRLWQLTSTRNVLGPKEALGPLTKTPMVEVAGSFNVHGDGRVQTMPAAEGQQLWLRIKNVLPRAAVYSQWISVENGGWRERLNDPAWDPTRSVVIQGVPAATPGPATPCIPAEILAYESNRVELKARSQSGGILMLNDRYDARWKALVDGKSAPIFRCNGAMRGVAVTGGEHKVVFLYHPDLACFVANLVATLVLLLWAVVRLTRRTNTREWVVQ